MFSRLCVLIALIFATATATTGAATAAPPLMETINAEMPVKLQSLHIHGDIAAGMAETTVRMVFFNPNARALEGRLQFPLLAGQQISSFALDIDGKLRAAVPVEKAKGRRIFEAVERRGIDPGLLEQTQGNNFKLRVYPIPARGTRVVELKYAEAMTLDGKSWQYQVPLAYGERLQDFDLSVNIRGSSDVPKASGTLGAVRFNRDARGYFTHVGKSRFTPSGVMNILIPRAQHALTYSQEHDGDTYFVAEIPVATTRSPRPLPQVVGLLWDSSGSGAGRAHEAELAELDRYFKALDNAEVRLVRLRDRSEAAENFKIVHGNWDALRAALQSTVYDGASALADWQPQADVNEYLLVSDGLLNYGADRFPVLASGQRLYALNSSLTADTARLAALAERSGGRLVQIVPGKPGIAAEALLTDGSHIAGVHAEGATDIVADPANARQGLVRVAGRLLAPEATLTITLVEQGKPHNTTIAVAATDPRHAQVATLWAGYRLRALESDYEANRGAIRRLGAQFSMPTRETSLIVLDRLEDYVRYDIVPPAEYLAAYEKLKATNGAQLMEKRQKHLERIVSAFEQKVAWWEKSYPKNEPPLKPETRLHARPPSPAVVASAAPPSMAAPAPAPAPESALMRSAPNFLQADARTKDTSAGTGPAPEIGITLKKWTPDAPYITRMQAASADTIYQVYLDEKPSYANSSAFYLDVADMLFEKGRRELALRVLSNLAEMDLEDRHVLRILGYRLMQAGVPELAIRVFEKVQYLAEEEPQSFRDLGLAHAAAGHRQQAIDQLNEVIMRPWENRFADIELIALAEMNAIIATSAQAGLDTSRIDPRLLKNLPLDLRAVLTWDADNSDMDLWVTDPNGEKCYYGHRLTYQGGSMSRDFTGGYGPEEFSLREAKPGKYKIEVNFFGSGQQIVAGATTLQVKLSSGFGTSAAQERMVTLRLKGRGQSVLVGEFDVAPK